MTRGTFVFCICGDAHVARANIALRFLKRWTHADILVVATRTSVAIDHDQVLWVDVPTELSDRHAIICLKTALPRLVDAGHTACYLDNDQIATSAEIDRVFAFYNPPITFAADHTTIDEFSHHAVRCRCTTERCGHLRSALRDRFGVRIDIPDWRHWNGGLCLFDRQSRDFCIAWHNNTLLAFEDPYWCVRDQGTLIATVWQHALQDHPVLPPSMTRIVDKYLHCPEALRPSRGVQDYFIDDSYGLGSDERPAFLHFINDGVGSRGWANWDDAEMLLTQS